jgi:Flp pilus assembly protein TadB
VTDVGTPNTSRTGLGLVGAGAIACVACCAAPIAGVVAATGIASLLGAVAFGVVGLLAALVVGTVLWQRRPRRQQQRCAPADDAVSIETPQLRTRG